MNDIADRIDPGVLIRFRNWLDSGYAEPYAIEIFREDLRLLLAALDPAEQPIEHVPTEAGLDYLALRREQHPGP
jgi:hypothetical protein